LRCLLKAKRRRVKNVGKRYTLKLKNKKDGSIEWIENKVTGHKLKLDNLPQEVRNLPEELIATDLADPEKVYKSDAPHIIDELSEEHIKAQETPKEIKKLRCAQVGEYVPLSQWEIDVVRMRVIKTTVDSMLVWADRGIEPDYSVNHLWFPDDNVNHYELRKGNPPSNRDRPKHLHGFSIEIDVLCIPERVQDLIDANQAIEDANNANHGVVHG